MCLIHGMGIPPEFHQQPPPTIRWWVGGRLLIFGIIAILFIRFRSDWAFQKRNLLTLQVAAVIVVGLLVWWCFLSRAPRRWRWQVPLGLFAFLLFVTLLFRWDGLSGDLSPILTPRWVASAGAGNPPAPHPGIAPSNNTPAHSSATSGSRSDFPQFYGPKRDGIVEGPVLATDWQTYPPVELWRIPVGAGWGGFAIVGEGCVVQEQRGEDECVVLRNLFSGKEVWTHADRAHFSSVIAGDGPRATPTVVGQRVFTFGATGILNCLDLATGKPLWSHDVVREFGGSIPQWGATSSPLLAGGLVIVHAAEGSGNSLLAFRSEDGALAWKAGDSPSYASPVIASLAGVMQVVSFNDGSISGHLPETGKTLWRRGWGNGNVVCALPIAVDQNRVLFSSGYGVGAELLELSKLTNGSLAINSLWKSIRLKSKFAHLFVKDNCVFGLDDGIFACVDLKDGTQRWKEGRYGHGQGILVGDLYLLIAESGDLVLLRPTPASPGEIGRFPVLHSKTWNPPALSGDILLVRNDREAAGFRLPRAASASKIQER